MSIPEVRVSFSSDMSLSISSGGFEIRARENSFPHFFSLNGVAMTPFPPAVPQVARAIILTAPPLPSLNLQPTDLRTLSPITQNGSEMSPFPYLTQVLNQVSHENIETVNIADEIEQEEIVNIADELAQEKEEEDLQKLEEDPQVKKLREEHETQQKKLQEKIDIAFTKLNNCEFQEKPEVEVPTPKFYPDGSFPRPDAVKDKERREILLSNNNNTVIRKKNKGLAYLAKTLGVDVYTKKEESMFDNLLNEIQGTFYKEKAEIYNQPYKGKTLKPPTDAIPIDLESTMIPKAQNTLLRLRALDFIEESDEKEFRVYKPKKSNTL